MHISKSTGDLGRLEVQQCRLHDNSPLVVDPDLSTVLSAESAAEAMTTTMAADTPQRPHTNKDSSVELPRPYKCPLCDKAFHRLEHQTRHIRTHTGEKPHFCQYPGCAKRFSRSDELTRHARIHTNPNSRRGNKQQAQQAHHHAAVAIQTAYDPQIVQQHFASQMGPPQPQPLQTMMLPPLHQSLPRSASSSKVNSPNVSPPQSYLSMYSSNPNHYFTRNSSGDLSPAGNSYHMDINLLATAASQVEREGRYTPSHLSNHSSSRQPSGPPTPYSAHPHSSSSSSNRLPSLSHYHYSSAPTSQPMSRSHSHEDDDHYHSHRHTKKSRPGSPISTAPPSPDFPPNESTSPTPDHTPLATPSHSPRLRPQYYNNNSVQLPTLHHLSLKNHQPPPALAPVEPSADGHQPYVPIHHSGPRISDIIRSQNGAQRKLPIPMLSNSMLQVKVTGTDVLSGSSSDPSSNSGSVAGDLQERY